MQGTHTEENMSLMLFLSVYAFWCCLVWRHSLGTTLDCGKTLIGQKKMRKIRKVGHKSHDGRFTQFTGLSFILRLYSSSTFDIKTYAYEIMAKYLQVVPGAVAFYCVLSWQS